MSTLSVSNLKHGSSASNNLVLDANGNVTAAGTVAMATPFGMRNKIINGAMEIDQRATSLTATGYTVDRWEYADSVASKATVAQSSISPPGFSKSVLATSSSAYSVTASDYYLLIQKIEGLNCIDLAWGTASAKSITLSFWVRSSLTGTFGGSIRNSATDRSYVFSYSISAANTWEQKTITIPGDTTGTWLTTNGIGIRLAFGFGVGSTFSGSAGSWSSSNLFSVTGATSVVGTNGATFYLTGVQLEVGSVATPFERRLYGQELALCQRYCQVMRGQGTYTVFGNGAFTSATNVYAYTALPVVMRSSPNIVYSAANTFYIDNGSAAAVFADQSGPYGFITAITSGTSQTAGVPSRLLANNNSTAAITITAEL